MDRSKIKLCFVSNMLGRTFGYVPTQGLILADLFAREGHKVISVSSKLNPAFRLIDVIQTIIRKRKEIDVLVLDVFSSLNIQMANATTLICKQLGIPLISVLHGPNLPLVMKRFPLWTSLFLKRAGILVAPSTFLVEKMAAFNFHVRVVPNTIDLAAYPYKARKKISPNLIWMRTFQHMYNPHLAIKVLSSLRSMRPEATLVMAGVDKGLETEVKQLTDELGLTDSVRFAGFLEMEDKIKEFSKADIYLNTNRIDHMPVSVIEACAMGLPVVATNVGGIPKMITHGKNGLLVHDNNSDEMVDAINTLLNNPELTETISKNGRFLAENSAWESVRYKWEELFSEAMDRKNL